MRGNGFAINYKLFVLIKWQITVRLSFTKYVIYISSWVVFFSFDDYFSVTVL